MTLRLNDHKTPGRKDAEAGPHALLDVVPPGEQALDVGGGADADAGGLAARAVRGAITVSPAWCKLAGGNALNIRLFLHTGGLTSGPCSP
jgi:hypothetical protein